MGSISLYPRCRQPVGAAPSARIVSPFHAIQIALVSALTAGACAAEPAKYHTPVSPTLVTVPPQSLTLRAAVEELARQTGFLIDLSGVDGRIKITPQPGRAPFWQMLETLARETRTRVECRESEDVPGKRLVLVPADKAAVRSSVDGPFRIAAREVRARRAFDSDRSTYDMTLEVSWEPRFEVFRIESEPEIARATDNLGTALRRPASQVTNSVNGYTTFSTFRLEGLTRKATSIAVLEGAFTVTATPAMLPFTFTNLTGTKPMSVEREGVTVTLESIKKDVKLWSIDMVLHYPPGGPRFESFEENWLRANTLTLIAPDGKRHAVRNVEISGLSLMYRFEEGKELASLPNGLSGWKIEYTTPGPLREYPVRFRLEDIPLP